VHRLERMPKTGMLLDAQERRSFTTWLAEAVKRAGLSGGELGRRLGYRGENARKPARRYLRAGTIPTETQARALSAALDVTELEMLVRAGHLDAVLPAIDCLATVGEPWARNLAFNLVFALFPPGDVFGEPLVPLHDGLQQAKGAIVDAAQGAIVDAAQGLTSEAETVSKAFEVLATLVSRSGAKHRTLRNKYVRRAKDALHDSVLSPRRRRAVAASYLHDWMIQTYREAARKRLSAMARISRMSSTKKRRTQNERSR
jgi:hypothetical protein